MKKLSVALACLSILFPLKVASASLRESQVITPHDDKSVHRSFSLHSAAGAPVTLSVGNLLGNISYYRTQSELLTVGWTRLRYTTENAELRIWEVEPGKFKLYVEYPTLEMQAPVGDFREIDPKKSPERGIIVKGGATVFGGTLISRFGYPRTTSTLPFEGSVGETHLRIGLPESVTRLSSSTMTGDIDLTDLGPSLASLPKTFLLKSDVGEARFHDLTFTTRCENGLRKKPVADIFDYDRAAW